MRKIVFCFVFGWFWLDILGVFRDVIFCVDSVVFKMVDVGGEVFLVEFGKVIWVVGIGLGIEEGFVWGLFLFGVFLKDFFGDC